MTRYADPQRCPDCLSSIEYGSTRCPSCDLSLVGPLAARLFQTLTDADQLITALRASEAAVNPTPAPLPTAPSPTPSLSTTPRLPADERPAPKRGLSAASVPKILLGLGAMCLLVAALVFLVVTWSVMGVAGRTATLVGFTAVAGGLAAWMSTRNLRTAAEALSLVALGLLSFDLFGARDSGWFGDIGEPGFFVLLGSVVTLAAGAAGLAARRTPIGALTGAEIVGALGAAAAVAGFVGGDWLAPSATLTAAVVLSGAATFAAHRLRLATLAAGIGLVTACTWLGLAVTAFERAVSNPTARELWLELEAWPLLATAALAGGLALVRRFPLPVRVSGVAVAETVLAALALIPFSQGTTTEFTLAMLPVLAVACALTWFAREPWSVGCAATAALGAGWLVILAGGLSEIAGARLFEAGASMWEGTIDGRLPQQVLGAPEPWLLPIATVSLIAFCAVLAHSISFIGRLVAPLGELGLGPVIAAGLLVASGVATVALYAVPVWLVLGLMLPVGIAFTSWSLSKVEFSHVVSRRGSLALGSTFVFLALAISLYAEWLTAAALGVALTLTVAVHLRWTGALVSTIAGAVLAASLAASVWTWGALAHVDATWVALSALVALGALVLGVPFAGARAWRLYRDLPGAHATQRFTGVEIGALVSGFVVGTAGVAAAPYSAQSTWAAGYLTAGGLVISLISLLRPDRRDVGWLGGALLAIASWVRLWDVGVRAPEAYTVPSAVALAIAGVVYLHRHPGSSTMTALAPSLGLGLVPSLLWVVGEPVGLRSVLLGVACLALVAIGVRLKWTAPVVFGAAVGSVLVLRHAFPVADAVPQWVLIGSAGTLLVAMGVTWERRLQEARSVYGYVRALR